MRDYHLHSKNDIWTHNNCTDDSSGSNKMLKLIATLSYQLGLTPIHSTVKYNC